MSRLGVLPKNVDASMLSREVDFELTEYLHSKKVKKPSRSTLQRIKKAAGLKTEEDDVTVVREIERYIATERYKKAHDLYLSTTKNKNPESYDEFMARWVEV